MSSPSKVALGTGSDVKPSRAPPRDRDPVVGFLALGNEAVAHCRRQLGGTSVYEHLELVTGGFHVRDRQNAAQWTSDGGAQYAADGRCVERIPNSGRVPERAVDPQRKGSAKQIRAV